MNAPIPEVTTQAADWLVRLRCPDAPASLQAAFADWLRQSPVHIEEYLRAVEVWEGLGDPRVNADADLDALVAQAGTDTVVAFAPTTHESGAGKSFSSNRRFIRLAAGLAAVAMLGAVVFNIFVRQPARFHTELGESRVITLQDRSVINLNTQTEVLVKFTGTERRIELLQGEAMFEVTKDPRRPFVVYSGNVSTRAVGTQFSVNRLQKGVVVTVSEGRVFVAESGVGATSQVSTARAVEVTAGEQATATAQGIVTAKVSVEKVLAWRDGKLEFDNERLADVIQEFNRYNSEPLMIADPSLAERRISGVFRTHDPESLVAFLTSEDHFTVTHGTSGEVILGSPSP